MRQGQEAFVPGVWRRRAVTLALAALLGLAPMAAGAFQQIRGVQIGHTAGYTRLILESDRPIRFVLSPRGRERALLELADVTLGPILRALPAEVGTANPYVETLSLRQPGERAVILELGFRGPAQARAVALPPSVPGAAHQLVVDIYPVPAEPAAAPVATPALAGEELWLSARVNGQGEGETALFLKTPDGRLLARQEDLRRWRLQTGSAVLQAGEPFVALDTLDGLSYRLDEASQALELQAKAQLFDSTTLQGSAVHPAAAMPSAPGGFLNYELVASRDDSDTRHSGLFELGLFGRLGVGTTTLLRRDADDAAATVRLDSTWTLDRPAKRASWRAGDAVSRAPAWGGAVRFGGLQWSTNFATQPGFNTMPLPAMTGEAVVPSTVDLYVNGALRLREDVPPGPFTLQDLPVVSGAGDIRLVVRDLLGREQVLTQSFYASPRLLRPGLHDYSYELGAVRENYGLASNDYGRLLAVGTHRLGLTSHITAEAHAELLADQQTLGLGAAGLIPGLGLLSASAAASQGEAGSGHLVALGLERQGRRFSLGASTELASAAFTRLGQPPGAPAPRQRSRAYSSLATGRHGSLNLAYTREAPRDEPELRLLSASYNLNLGRAYLAFTALHTLAPEADTVLGLTLTQALGGRSNYSIGTRRQDDVLQSELQLQRGLPAGSGVGYRLRAGVGETDSQELALSAQNNVGTYLLEAAQREQQLGLRASASGGLALVRDGIYASRRINDSFAVVHVPEHPGVRVYADNQVVGRTGADGSVLIPRLRAYQANPIRIEQADLPLDSRIGRLEFEAVPAYRSGLLLQFPIQRTHGATLTLRLDDDRLMPAGAVAQLGGAEFPVGERGELYLSGLARHNRVTVTWQGQRCELDVTYPDSDDPLPDLGSHLCTGVKP